MSRSAAQPRKAWPFLPAMLRVSAIVELATGCALLATPSVVIQALIGSPSNQVGWIVARILGGALLALGVAGMLTRGESTERGVALAFIVYDTSTAVVLAWAGAAGAILTMLSQTMMPEAFEHGGKLVGVVTTLGFAVAFTIHTLD